MRKQIFIQIFKGIILMAEGLTLIVRNRILKVEIALFGNIPQRVDRREILASQMRFFTIKAKLYVAMMNMLKDVMNAKNGK